METVNDTEPLDPVRTPVDEMARFVHDVAIRCGLPPAHAELFTHALIAADLRGIPSHGLFRLGIYARGFTSGNINPTPDLIESGDRNATRVIDGDNGLGLVVGQLAMQRAIELAAANGIGMVSVRNSNHSGVLAVHALRAVEAGMIGFFTSNAPALMAPWGAQDPLLSNSPFAYAFPGRGHPIVVDMACSAVARGRIRLAAVDNQPIPLGWALDSDGHATDDPLAAMDGVVLPMGEHKGSGLAIAHEILATCLSGALLSMEVPRGFLKHGADTLDSWGVGHLALAIDVGASRPLTAFEGDVSRLSDAVHDMIPRPGVARVLMPGEPEDESAAAFRRDGLGVSVATCQSLATLAAELAVELPPQIAESARRYV